MKTLCASGPGINIEKLVNFGPYFDLLKDEILDIQEKFDKVIMHSQGIDEIHTDEIFNKWIKNKKWFIDKVGGLIYEIPNVSFELSDEEKNKRIETFIREDVFDVNAGLSAFLEDNKDGFFENKVLRPYEGPGFDKEGHLVERKVPKGMKISKAMKLFETDPVTLYILQTKMSMILQENKINGTLCFSVHPLDYLSSSENNFNWRSCHALDGEYRAGNLSYMMDSSTVICYLKSDKDVILPRFPEDVPWNNKKWRMLLFFSEQKTAHFAGRQYPFFSMQALNIIKEKFLEPKIYYGPSTKWTNWQLKRTDQFEGATSDNWLINDYIGIAGILYDKYELIKDAPNSRHFNDLLHSSCYTPYYGWSVSRLYHKKEQFLIGSEVPCLYCGDEIVITDSTMLCADHEILFGKCESEDFERCDICGEYVYSQNLTWDKDLNVVCPDCLDSLYIYCDSCQEYVRAEESVFDPETSKHICEKCFEKKYKEK